MVSVLLAVIQIESRQFSLQPFHLGKTSRGDTGGTSMAGVASTELGHLSSGSSESHVT